MDLRIDFPLALLLFIPLCIYFGWTWWRHRASMKKSQFIVFLLRILTILMLVLAMASPYLLLPVKEEQVVYLLDRSASMKGTEQQALDFIANSLKEKDANHSVGLYSFADSLQTEMSLSQQVDKLPELSQIGQTEQTNIASAIQLATGIADRDKATRIVLLSDGLETKGQVMEEVSKLAGSNVTVDTVPLQKPVTTDVSVQSFVTPQLAYEGEQQQLITEVMASEESSGELYLYENDQLIHRERVTLAEGTNVFTYRHIGQAEGLVKYQALVQVGKDALLENNKLTSVTMVQSAPKLLLVHNSEEGSAIKYALGSNSIAYDEVQASELPNTLSSYLAYNAIIFDNVPGYVVGEAKMDVIEQAVKNFGVGFMMVGGDNSFGLGGYFKTPIEALLPVEMEVKGKQQLPSLGLVLVIDRSGSMTGSKMELAKEAAARSVELLRDGDTLGVIAFDGSPWTIIETAPLKDKEAAVDSVLSITPNGGTDIFPALAQAYENLQDLKLQRKHIILLTDGQSGTNADYETLIENGKENKITLSTVAVGSDADRVLLEMLSELASGRYYDVVDETTIPAILSRETAMISRTYIEDNPFYPTIFNANDWNSLFAKGVPEMNAYIGTTAKQSATVIAESDKEDPVLAQWQYGLGTTIAFTSDSSGAWTGDWVRWSEWSNFWQTAISKLLPSYNEIAYDIRMEVDGSYVVTDPTNEAAFLDVAVVNEAGEELDIQFEPVSASKLRVVLDADPGLVFFRITNEEQTIYQAGVNVPYSAEYNLQPTNESFLAEIADRSGGEVLEEPASVFRPFTQRGMERQSITEWLVVAGMLLFFLDITLRRFGWSFGSRRTKSKKGDTKTVIAEQTNVGHILKGMKKR